MNLTGYNITIYKKCEAKRVKRLKFEPWVLGFGTFVMNWSRQTVQWRQRIMDAIVIHRAPARTGRENRDCDRFPRPRKDHDCGALGLPLGEYTFQQIWIAATTTTKMLLTRSSLPNSIRELEWRDVFIAQHKYRYWFSVPVLLPRTDVVYRVSAIDIVPTQVL